MKLAYIDISTVAGSQREFGIYDPDSKAVFVLENNAVSMHYVSVNKNWKLLSKKWEDAYKKWYDIKDKYKDKNKPKNLMFALNLFELINNKDMVIERGRTFIESRKQLV